MNVPIVDYREYNSSFYQIHEMISNLVQSTVKQKMSVIIHNPDDSETFLDQLAMIIGKPNVDQLVQKHHVQIDSQNFYLISDTLLQNRKPEVNQSVGVISYCPNDYSLKQLLDLYKPQFLNIIGFKHQFPKYYQDFDLGSDSPTTGNSAM